MLIYYYKAIFKNCIISIKLILSFCTSRDNAVKLEILNKAPRVKNDSTSVSSTNQQGKLEY